VARGAVFAAVVVAVVGCCTRAYAQEPGALPLIFSRSARSAEGPAAAAVWKFCFIDVERTVRPIVNCLLSPPPPPPPPPPLLGLAEAAESYEIFRTTCEGQIRFMEGTPWRIDRCHHDHHAGSRRSEKNAPSFAPFDMIATKNDHFSKTGSGQT
jgi:hypothetical protein